jgi:molybdenum cofactor cytidylyltransferase
VTEGAAVAAVVLAAGGATRFGATKVLAALEGRPLLQHVLDALDAAGIADVVVVLGDTADDVARAIDWRTERRVLNPEPAAGLSSSLRIGLRALPPHVALAVVLLGDQPLVRPAVIRAIVDRAAGAARPIVVPRYERDGGRNPVVLRRDAWALADAATGDRGLGPLIASRPELVDEVAVAGDNPDVDTPEDLRRLGRGDVSGARGGDAEPADREAEPRDRDGAGAVR